MPYTPDPYDTSQPVGTVLAATAAAEFRALKVAAGLIARNNTWTKAQRGAYSALLSVGGVVAIDLALSNNYNHTLTENTTLDAPTNPVAGQNGIIQITQHAAAAKTLAYNAFWRMGEGVSLTISTTLSSVNDLSYAVDSSGAFAVCTMQKAVAAAAVPGASFGAYFASAAQVITAGGLLTLPHSMSAVPKLIRCYIKCTATDLGYAVDDLLEIGAPMSGAGGRGVSIVFDVTNLVIRFGNDAQSIECLVKGTGAPGAITNAKWQAFFCAWA